MIRTLRRKAQELKAHLVRLTRGNKFVWNGIYADFHTIPEPSIAFNSQIWLSFLRGELTHHRDAFIRTGSLDKSSPGHDLLALTTALMLQKDLSTKKNISILDIGGGAGISYLHVLNALPQKYRASVSYTVYETENVCTLGKELFKDDRFSISFTSTLPDRDTSSFDIIYISTALQYFSDYKAILDHCRKSAARCILFTRLSAGEHIPSFATAQTNLKGHTIPYWFLSLQEIVGQLSAYDLVYDEKIPNIYSMDNFPPSHRLPYLRNLLFTRNAQ
jgi:putative methyltransferase (TIGR04325 family)